MLSALGRQAVRKALTKSVGNVSVNSVRQASGVWMYRRVGPLDSKADVVQVGSRWDLDALVKRLLARILQF